jgi:DNA-binding NarL/FixJ family response regulator
MAIHVLLINAHSVLRDGLRSLLQRDGLVVSEAQDLEEVMPSPDAIAPDVIVLDLAAPRLDCLAAAREAVRAFPQTRVVLLAFDREEYLVTTALQMGIKGYVLKTRAVEELPEAIREVAGGSIYVSPRVLAGVA